MPSDVVLAVTGLALALWLALAYVARYGKHWWWDNLAHLAAGVTIGGIVVALAAWWGVPWWAQLSWPVALAALAALVWEAFEFARGIWPWVKHNGLDEKWSDTILDSYLVLTGALAAAALEVALTYGVIP